MSPYRNMNLPTMPRPSWWSRLCAAVTPKRIGAQHQWYRRAVGGRWSQIPGDGDSWRWVRTPVCLGPVVTRALGGEPAPVGVCFDERENNLMRPAASSERARAVVTVLRAVGFGAELLAFWEGPTACVVLGDVAHIKSLIEPHGYLVVEDRAPYGLAPVPREELAARLDLLGRGDDAAKVRHGPPDEPQPRGASLLVVALADVVAVCWSHMRGEA